MYVVVGVWVIGDTLLCTDDQTTVDDEDANIGEKAENKEDRYGDASGGSGNNERENTQSAKVIKGLYLIFKNLLADSPYER